MLNRITCGLAGISLALSTAPHIAHGQSISPIQKASTSITTQTSTTGWRLAANVMMQRNAITEASGALLHLLPLAPNDLTLPKQALSYAAMDGRTADAISLARTMPDNDIAAFLLAEEALAHHQTNETRYILNRTSHPGPLIALVSPILTAWSLVDESEPLRNPSSASIRQAITLLNDAASFGPTRSLLVLHAALIAERVATPETIATLYNRVTQSAPNAPALQILNAQLESGWLAQTNHRQNALKRLADLGTQSALTALTVDRLQEQLRPRAPLSAAQATAILNVQIAVMLTGSSHDPASRDVAIIALQQALHLDPNLTVARIFLADLFRDEDQAAHGLTILNSIPDTDPLAVLAAQERVTLANQTHDTDATRHALQHALTLRPDDQIFLTQLADTEEAAGLHQDAIKHYSHALVVSSPRRDDVWPLLLTRAMAYDNAGDWPHAREDIMHAFDLAPNEPDVLNGFGYASIEHDDNPALALQSLQKALKLQPDNTAFQDSYAWALIKLKKDLKTATPILNTAAEHAPNDPEIAYHLGVAYWYQGRHTEAQDQWNQALDDQPSEHDRTLIDDALRHNGPHLPIFEHSSGLLP